MKMIRAIPVFAKTIALVLAVLCFSGTGFAQKQGGTLTVGLELDVLGLDPLKVGVYDTSGNMVAAALFDTLTAQDSAGKAIPKLAVSWGHSDDYKTWTFKLRPGVVFHDGSPFNAQAVKWNFDRQKDPANKCRCAFYISFINRVEVLDDTTVVYHLNDPSVMLPEIMAPPTQNNVFHSPAAVAAKGDDYNRNPVGTGPFLLKSWAAGDRIVLEHNSNYWNTGHPRLERLVFKPLPDSQSRFASLQSGEVDIVWEDEYSYQNIVKAKGDKRLAVHEYVGSGAQVYAINTKVAPLDDVRVRRALVMAIDRKTMSDAITGGLGKPAVNPYGNGSWVKCEDDGALSFDPQKSRDLLKEYGKPVAFKMIVAASPRGRAIGQVMQQFWKRVGATMEIEQIDQASIVPRAFQRQFQMTPWRIIDLADPDPQMYANFHTGSPVALANYSNPELDKLLERARMTADTRIRNADYCEIGRIINGEAIWFWTFQNTYYAISKARLKGLPHMFGGVIDVSDTWLE